MPAKHFAQTHRDLSCVTLQVKATEYYFPMEMFGFAYVFVFNILQTNFAEISQF